MARDAQNRSSRRPQGRLIGYARVSTDEQATEAQEIELRSAGCDVIVQKHGSGASRARPALSKLLREINAGDTLIVVRLDRLARSVSHLLEVIEDLTAKNAHFRSLRHPIDTSTPQGMFSLQVLGAVAQLERALISERTKAGIKAAKSKGRLPGNPRIRERRPEALAKMTAAQSGVRRTRTGNGQSLASDRSAHAAGSHLGRYRPRIEPTRPRLDAGTSSPRREMDGRGADGRCGIAAQIPSPPARGSLVAGIHSSNPNLTLREIATQLERLHERTTRGGSKWSPSSVKNLIDRARRSGLIASASDTAAPLTR